MNPAGVVLLTPAGPGAVASQIGFDVSGTGDFTVTFTFINPYPSAAANGSASFNFDPDVLTFVGGDFSSGGMVWTDEVPGAGSSIQIDRLGLDPGTQSLTLFGRINSDGTPEGGNDFARVGGSLTLTAIPEPATWALFVLGFGTVGAVLRRRSGAVRLRKAELRFA